MMEKWFVDCYGWNIKEAMKNMKYFDKELERLHKLLRRSLIAQLKRQIRDINKYNTNVLVVKKVLEEK